MICTILHCFFAQRDAGRDFHVSLRSRDVGGSVRASVLPVPGRGARPPGSCQTVGGTFCLDAQKRRPSAEAPFSTVQHLVSLRLEGLFPRGCGNREVAASLVIRAPGGAAARLGEQRRFRPGWPRRNLGEHLLPVFTGRGALGSPAGASLGDLSPRRFRLPSLSRHGTRDGSSLGGTRVNRQI